MIKNKEFSISRINNFDILRLLAALQVLIGHSVKHLNVDVSLHEITKAFPGVLIFFTISGFLITASYYRNSNNIKKYLRNRCLRIFPALWVSTLLLIILIFLFSNETETSSLLTIPFFAWIFGELTIFQFYTPDSLRWFGVGAPNGSLWTISVEFIFYLTLPMIFYLSKKKLKTTILLFFLFSILYNFYISEFFNGDTIIEKLMHISILKYLYNFLLGSLIFIFWNKIHFIFTGKFLFWLFLYSIAYWKLGFYPSYELESFENLTANLLLSFLTISAAYTLPNLGEILKGYDISYGIYIYHMLVVNSFVQLNLTGRIDIFIITIIVSIILGFLSWVFIEKKALSLK